MKELSFLIEESQEGAYSAKALGEALFLKSIRSTKSEITSRQAVACNYDENSPASATTWPGKREATFGSTESLLTAANSLRSQLTIPSR